MPPKCEKKQPTFRINLHVPATNWHPHKDKTLEVKAETEFEAWAKAVREMLMVLTQGNGRLMVGYLADMLNNLPVEVRTALVAAMAQGFGLAIKPVEGEEGAIEVGLVQRYPPLIEPKETPSGIALPGGQKPGDAGLVLPTGVPYKGKKR